MLGVRQIKTDGTIINLHRKHLTLKEMQALVATGTDNSYIELVPIPGQFTDKVGNEVMFAHEEGLLHGLPINLGASVLVGHGIVGDVLIAENEASDFQ